MSRALQSLSSANPTTWSRERVGGDRAAHLAAHTDDRRHLELDVEARARPVQRLRGAGGERQPVRAHDRGAAHHDGAGAAGVADREVAPVRQEWFRARPQQLAEVRGVVQAGVEVDVVADLHRQHHLELVAAHEHVGARGRTPPPSPRRAPAAGAPAPRSTPRARGRRTSSANRWRRSRRGARVPPAGLPVRPRARRARGRRWRSPRAPRRPARARRGDVRRRRGGCRW